MREYTQQERNNAIELLKSNTVKGKGYNEMISMDQDGQMYYRDNEILVETSYLNDVIDFFEFINYDYESLRRNLSYDLFNDYVVYMTDTKTYLYIIG